MKYFEVWQLSVLSTTVRLTLPGLHVWKWLTVENIRNLEK